jgi:hypothetical protein
MKVLKAVRFALWYEWHMWLSLYRWLFRRPLVRESGAKPFGYARAQTPVLIAFIVVSAIEVPILDLVLPWPVVRFIALLLGVWGVVWMFGILAILRTHPHVVGPAGLRIRNGLSVDVSIPWALVADIRLRNRPLEPGRKDRMEVTDAGTVAIMPISNFTNVDVAFREPVVLPVPKTNGEPLIGLRFYADDEKELVAHTRTFVMAG